MTVWTAYCNTLLPCVVIKKIYRGASINLLVIVINNKLYFTTKHLWLIKKTYLDWTSDTQTDKHTDILTLWLTRPRGPSQWKLNKQQHYLYQGYSPNIRHRWVKSKGLMVKIGTKKDKRRPIVVKTGTNRDRTRTCVDKIRTGMD